MGRKRRLEIRSTDKQYIQKLIKELKLENTEAFYYSLVENIPQFIFCKDLAGNFTFVNQRFCELLGKSLHEVIGKNDYDFYPGELARKYREDDRKVIEQNRIFEDIEENKSPGRETSYVHVVKTPIHDANGTIIGMQGIFWDITKRKKAEEELKNANARMRQDLIAAARVQRGFIPDKPPVIPGYRFSWLFEPSEYIGGDLLNIAQLDENHWAFYVLDVSGHGVPAALLSVSLSRMIDQMSSSNGSAKKNGETHLPSDKSYDPIRLIRMLNDQFPGDKMMFCTLAYAILDTKDSSVTWVRAGHEPPLLVKKGGKTAEYFVKPGGICISNFPLDDRYLKSKKLTLEPGDRFILYSDGITEAMRNDREFGYDRLVDVMCRTHSSLLEDSLKTLIQTASDWTGSTHFTDDVTLLALEKTDE